MSKSLVLSVHQLVDFLLRSGDIDSRIFNRSSMKEGSRIHSRYQESQSKGYISEYPLKTDMVVDDVEITLQGRADGIIHRGDEYIIPTGDSCFEKGDKVIVITAVKSITELSQILR